MARKTKPETEPIRLPGPPRQALSRQSHIRRELASIYRDARAGRLDIEEAARLGFLLKMLSHVIRESAEEFKAESERAAKYLERKDKGPWGGIHSCMEEPVRLALESLEDPSEPVTIENEAVSNGND